MADILPIIKDYFKNVNSILPLFDENAFMASLDERRIAGGRVPVVHGAVNIMLALAFQFEVTSHLPTSAVNSAMCISKAESVIDSLNTNQYDLTGLQVLLGLIVFHLGTPHPGLSTASSLLGRAIKLTHRLRLHRKKTDALFETNIRLQRARVFWIVYTLDRYISSRTHDPPLQQNNDHDIMMPSSVHGAGRVTLTTQSGTAISLDIFQTWIHLARIQGVIYEQLYSVCAEAQSATIRQRNTKNIYKMLMEWLDTIPKALHPDGLLNVSPKPATVQLLLLHFMHLSCVLQLYRMISDDAEWISRLVAYSQRVVEAAGPETVSESSLLSFLKPSSAWPEAVGTARKCAKLFRLVDMNNSRIKW